MIMTRVRVALGAALLVAGLASSPAYAQSKPAQLVILTGSAGGAWYPIAVGIAGLFEKHGVRGGTDLGGGTANVINIAEGRGDIGMTFGVNVVSAIRGEEPFKQKYTGVKALSTLVKNYFQCLVTVESGVKSFADLKGKPVALQERQLASSQYFRWVLQTFGLTEDDLKVAVRGSISTIMNAVKDRRAVFLSNMPTLPDGATTELATTIPIRILPVPDENFKKLQEINPGFVRDVIPAGTYKGQTEDVPVFSAPTIFIVNDKMPEEHAYWIAKTLVQSLDDVRILHSSMKGLTAEEMARVGSIELHPGAARLYKEIGVRVTP
ncbi:MAG: TAXI family TRAP transporter solute-binding subunit [Proteobacteria bacterium]|nr:TAXI family TRAP transporter solute-binding subunit [Pseudomonadota bacterium]